MHSFIRSAKSCRVIEDLVHEYMPDIQNFRENQEEMEESENTMKADVNKGTVLLNDTKDGASQFESGTVVFSDTVQFDKNNNSD